MCSCDFIPPNLGPCFTQEPDYLKEDERLLNMILETSDYHCSIIYNDKLPKYLRGLHKTWDRQLKKSSNSTIDRIRNTYEVKQYAGLNGLKLDYR